MTGSLERIDLEDPRWASLLLARPEARLFHRVEWPSLLARTYGYRAFAVVWIDRGRVTAGAPFLAVGGPLRRRWVSLPFTDSCAPVGDPEAVRGFTCALEIQAREARLSSIEFRSRVASTSGQVNVVGVEHVLTLIGSPELLKPMSGARERNIRHARREGVAVSIGRTPDHIETFYRLHVRTRSRLGVPVQPIRFFRLLWESLIAPGLGFIAVARHGPRPLAAAIFLKSGSTLIYKFGASDERTWSYRPNDALFSDVIARAKADGYSALDFGRTDPGDEGLRRFKASWGAVEHDLEYTVLGEPRRLPQSRNPALLATLIKRSSPLVCRAIGEALYRYGA